MARTATNTTSSTNILALGSFLLAAYTVACWVVRCMKFGLLARLASPIAFPVIVAVAASSALGSWLNWKRRISVESPVALFVWPHVLGLCWTFSFFVLHSVITSLVLAVLFTVAAQMAFRRCGGARQVAGVLQLPLFFWAGMMLLMNAAFAAFKLGLLSFTGLQWWGIKHIGWGIFHTAQHLLLG